MRTRSYLCKSVPAAALVCLAALIATASAQAAPEWAPAAATASARHALRFWTSARMRQARPLEAPTPRGDGPAGVSATPSAGGEGQDSTDGQVGSSDLAVVPDPTAPGFRQNGAIFIVLPHHLGFGRCSGTAVDAPNRSVVITAGHCVNEFRHWFNQDWVFVPGYHDGVRPFGVFVAKWLGATDRWVGGGSENVDVGAAVVSRNERGQTLGAAVGGDHIAFGLSPNQVFDVHGYPVAPPFDGSSQRVCAGTPFLGHDLASFLWTGPLNLAVSCDVTGGASGGGWTIHGDVLNGVTNYGYGDDPATDFGAYFGGAVRELYEQAARMR